MFFHCLTKQGLFGDTHVQVIHAFPPKVRLFNPALHPASVAPFKQPFYILIIEKRKGNIVLFSSF